jgi:hypothetical protein
MGINPFAKKKQQRQNVDSRGRPPTNPPSADGSVSRIVSTVEEASSSSADTPRRRPKRMLLFGGARNRGESAPRAGARPPSSQRPIPRSRSTGRFGMDLSNDGPSRKPAPYQVFQARIGKRPTSSSMDSGGSGSSTSHPAGTLSTGKKTMATTPNTLTSSSMLSSSSLSSDVPSGSDQHRRVSNLTTSGAASTSTAAALVSSATATSSFLLKSLDVHSRDGEHDFEILMSRNDEERDQLRRALFDDVSTIAHEDVSDHDHSEITRQPRATTQANVSQLTDGPRGSVYTTHSGSVYTVNKTNYSLFENDNVTITSAHTDTEERSQSSKGVASMLYDLTNQSLDENTERTRNRSRSRNISHTQDDNGEHSTNSRRPNNSLLDISSASSFLQKTLTSLLPLDEVHAEVDAVGDPKVVPQSNLSSNDEADRKNLWETIRDRVVGQQLVQKRALLENRRRNSELRAEDKTSDLDGENTALRNLRPSIYSPSTPVSETATHAGVVAEAYIRASRGVDVDSAGRTRARRTPPQQPPRRALNESNTSISSIDIGSNRRPLEYSSAKPTFAGAGTEPKIRPSGTERRTTQPQESLNDSRESDKSFASIDVSSSRSRGKAAYSSAAPTLDTAGGVGDAYESDLSFASIDLSSNRQPMVYSSIAPSLKTAAQERVVAEAVVPVSRRSASTGRAIAVNEPPRLSFNDPPVGDRSVDNLRRHTSGTQASSRNASEHAIQPALGAAAAEILMNRDDHTNVTTMLPERKAQSRKQSDENDPNQDPLARSSTTPTSKTAARVGAVAEAIRRASRNADDVGQASSRGISPSRDQSREAVDRAPADHEDASTSDINRKNQANPASAALAQQLRQAVSRCGGARTADAVVDEDDDTNTLATGISGHESPSLKRRINIMDFFYYTGLCRPTHVSPNSIPQYRPYYNEQSSISFLHRLTHQGITLLYLIPPATPPHNTTLDWKGRTVVLMIEPGKGSSSFEPRLEWTTVPGGIHYESETTSIALLEIHSISTNTKRNPYGNPLADTSHPVPHYQHDDNESSVHEPRHMDDDLDSKLCFLTITTNKGDVYILEAPTVEEKNQIVNGLRNILARLSFHLVTGDVAATSELYHNMLSQTAEESSQTEASLRDTPARADISSDDLPPLTTPHQTMDKITHALLDSY